MACSCRWYISSRNYFIYRYRALLSSLVPPFFIFFLALYNFFNSFFQFPEFLVIRKSKLFSIIFYIILAGFPILTHFTLPCKPSTILSTDIFEGPHANTFCLRFTASTISSQTVVVLPVPGGPCSKWTVSVIPCFTAYICSSFRFLLWYYICFKFLGVFVGFCWKKKSNNLDSDFSISYKAWKYLRKVTSLHFNMTLQFTPS